MGKIAKNTLTKPDQADNNDTFGSWGKFTWRQVYKLDDVGQ